MDKQPSILREYFQEILLTLVLLVLIGVLQIRTDDETLKQGFAGVLGGLLTLVTKRVGSGPSNGSVQINNPPTEEKP